MAIQNIRFIDTLRGLAILGVLMVHTAQVGSPLTESQLNLFKQGAKGVQLFFIVSAFTMFMSLSRRSNEVRPYMKFYLRRFFRITPMYWLGILVYVIAGAFWLQPHAIRAIGLNLLFLHGFDPGSFNRVVPGGWSIGVEMAFYLCVPFLFRYINSLSGAIWFTILTLFLHCTVGVIVFWSLPFLLNEETYFFYINHYILGSLPVFGMGFILFYILSSPFYFIQLVLLFFGILFGSFLLWTLKLDYIYLLLSLSFIVLAYALDQDSFNFLNHSILRHIGKISFSLYLVHFGVLRLMQSFGFADLSLNSLVSYSIRFLILLLLAVPISTLFYNIVEIPFQQLGQRVVNSLDNND